VGNSLRNLRRADYGAVLELSRHALGRPAEQVGNPLWSTLEELESEVADWDTPPEETLFVEEHDGDVIGFGGVEVSEGWEHGDLFGPLVAPGFRERRIGSTLLTRSVERAGELGARSILASVGARNLTGRMLLESAGFEAQGGANAVYRLTRADHRPLAAGPGGVRVRAGGPDDLAAGLALYRECFPGGVFPEESWREGLERGDVYLAEADEKALAIVNIDPSDRWLYHVGVTEAERSRGVGSWLVSEALTAYWRRHPGDTLGLSVRADNVPALRLYRRQGFSPWLVLESFELALA
jgi:ribosomal protein S18 acetylase RimI-like enzyme